MTGSPACSTEMALPPSAEAPSAPAEARADGEIVRAVLDGDTAAFEALVFRHEVRVYRTLFRLTGHRETAEDLTQETFARVYRSLRKFRPEREFAPWLMAIAVNLFRDHHRRSARVVSLNAVEPVPMEPGQRRIADHNMRRERLRNAILQLPDEMRALIVLYYEEELSVKQIAEALKKRRGTVRVGLHRSRTRLKEILGEDTGGAS